MSLPRTVAQATNEELLDVVYAWPAESVCEPTFTACPKRNGGGYCCDCHSTAFNALDEVRRRIVAGAAALFGHDVRASSPAAR